MFRISSKKMKTINKKKKKKKFKSYYSERGAVTVFLVLILVPCIMVASIFVDASRVSLAQSVSKSAADLALNNALTNYDFDLEDWYGFIASQQYDAENGEQKFLKDSEKYFEASLKSQGMSDDELSEILPSFRSSLSGDVSDLLQISRVQEDGSGINPVEGADLANATMLKNQIVDFMKYRAPVSFGEDLYGRFLKSDGKLDEEMEEELTQAAETDANEPVTDAKKAYYNAVAEFNTDCLSTYTYLKENYTDKGYTNESVTALFDDISVVRDAYSEIAKFYVNYLYNTDGFNDPYYVKIMISNDASNYAPTAADIATDNGDGTYSLTFEQYSNYITDFEEAVDDLLNEEQECYEELTNSGLTISVLEQDDTNKVQFLMQAEDIIEDYKNDINNYANTAYKAYMDVCIADGDSVSISDGDKNKVVKFPNFDSYKLHIQNRVDNFNREETSDVLKYGFTDGTNGCFEPNFINSNITTTDNDFGMYISKLAIQSQTVKEFLNIISTKHKYTDSKANGNKLFLEDELKRLAEMIGSDETTLSDMYTTLDNVINGKDGIDKSLGDLIDESKKVYDALQTWENSCKDFSKNNGVQTQMQKDDLTEITKIKSVMNSKGPDDFSEQDLQDGCTFISTNDMTTLNSRLFFMKQEIEKVQNAYSSFGKCKFGGKEIKDIKSSADFKAALKNAFGGNEDIGLSISGNNTTADNLIKDSFNPNDETLQNAKNGISIFSNPNADNTPNMKLDPSEGFKPSNEMSAQYKLATKAYYVMDKEFGNMTEGTKDDAKKKKKDMDDTDSKAQTMKDDSSNYDGDQVSNINVIKDIGKDTKSYGDMDIAKGLFSQISNLLSGKEDITSMRDDIYLITYMTHMFSYATFQNELYFNQLSEDDMKNITTLDYQNKYASLTAIEDEDLTKCLNLSFTNKKINTAHNAAYGAELEYILYGKDTNKENLSSAYKSIFAIREMGNMVSGFVLFWNKNMEPGHETSVVIDGLADAIAVISHGIIPKAAVKAVAITALATLETIHDMDRLKSGFSVELYKTNDSMWAYAIPGGTSFENTSDMLPKDGDDDKGSSKLSYGPSAPNGRTKKNGVFYSDYLAFFLLAAFSNDKGGDCTLRMADVVQTNMNYLLNGTEEQTKEGSSEKIQVVKQTFYMKNAKTSFELKEKLKVDPIMINLPLYKDYNGSVNLSDGLCTFTIDEIRGY